MKTYFKNIIPFTKVMRPLQYSNLQLLQFDIPKTRGSEYHRH